MTPAQDATALADWIEGFGLTHFNFSHGTTWHEQKAAIAMIVAALRATSQTPDAVREPPYQRSPAEVIEQLARLSAPSTPSASAASAGPQAEAVRKAAEEVCAFDYADSCVELQHDIEALRTALATPSASASAGPKAEAVACPTIGMIARIIDQEPFECFDLADDPNTDTNEATRRWLRRHYASDRDIALAKAAEIAALYAHPQPQQADGRVTDVQVDAAFVRGFRAADGRGAVIEDLRTELRKLAIKQHVRPATHSTFVSNGKSCAVCKGEWEDGDPEHHALTCCAVPFALQQSPATDNK